MRARRARIVDCAHAILAESGIHGLTIRKLADAADVAPRTIYRLFDDKDGVIFATVADRMREVREAIVAQNRTYDLPTVFAELDWMVSEMQQDTDYARIVVGFFFSMEPRRKEIRELRSVALTRFRNWLDYERVRGQLRPDVDHDMIARAHVANEWIVYRRFLLGMASDTRAKLELRACFLQAAILVLCEPPQEEAIAMLIDLQKQISQADPN